MDRTVDFIVDFIVDRIAGPMSGLLDAIQNHTFLFFKRERVLFTFKSRTKSGLCARNSSVGPV